MTTMRRGDRSRKACSFTGNLGKRILAAAAAALLGISLALPAAAAATGPKAPSPIATPSPIPTPTPVPAVIEPQGPTPTEEPVVMMKLLCGAEAPSTDFDYPWLSERAITQEEMDAWLSDDPEDMKFKSQMAEDEIFVRYGYHYRPDAKNPASRAAYKKYIEKDWYQQARAYNTIEDGSELMKLMTQIEKDNIHTINDWQNLNCPN